MSALTDTCRPEQLDALLQSELNAEREHDLVSHLNGCEQCRRELEHRAAEPSSWDEAKQFLNSSQSVKAASDEYVSQEAQRSPQIQNVLDALGPTDDPEMMGRFGGHEVSGVIGTGAMGVVLKAVDKSLDRVVAIKVLSPHLASSGAARKRFSREAKAAAAVMHPNVMAIHSVSNDESLPYLVMPYLRGSSLQTRLDNEGPLAPSEILRVGSQIAAGLAAAHAQGIVHRDIKPANILLEEGVERVAITDFGLARAVDDATMTRSGTIAGTPQYMSPEQARGETIDQRSDLFSLGSVLYAMCTGRPPFRAETSYGVMRRITDEEPRPIREINPDIPEWLCTIIDRLMAKRAVDRFENSDDVVDLLGECLAHVQQPTIAPLPERCVSRQQKHTALIEQKVTKSNRLPVFKALKMVALALALVSASIVIVLEMNKGKVTIECEADGVPVRIMQGKEIVAELIVNRAGATIRVAAGNYVIEIEGTPDGLIVKDGVVTLQRRGREMVRIILEATERHSSPRRGGDAVGDDSEVGDEPGIPATPGQGRSPSRSADTTSNDTPIPVISDLPDATKWVALANRELKKRHPKTSVDIGPSHLRKVTTDEDGSTLIWFHSSAEPPFARIVLRRPPGKQTRLERAVYLHNDETVDRWGLGMDEVTGDSAQRVESLTAIQAVARGQELSNGCRRVKVRFRVASAFSIRILDMDRNETEWLKLTSHPPSSEFEPKAFSIRVTPEVLATLSTTHNYIGRVIEAEGIVLAIPEPRIYKDPNIWTYFIRVTSPDQIRILEKGKLLVPRSKNLSTDAPGDDGQRAAPDLAPAGGDVKASVSDDTPLNSEILTAKQAVKRGARLERTGQEVAVRFRVASARPVSAIDPTGNVREQWVLSSEPYDVTTNAFAVVLRSRVLAAVGNVDVSKEYSGQVLEVRGRVLSVITEIYGQPALYIYYIEVDSLNQVRRYVAGASRKGF